MRRDIHHPRDRRQLELLGHDDHDRSRYQGPEHRACNRAGRPAWRPPGGVAIPRP